MSEREQFLVRELPIEEQIHLNNVECVINADFGDSTVIKLPNTLADGSRYIAYGTETFRQGRWIRGQVATSVDARNWDLKQESFIAENDLGIWSVGTHVWAPFPRFNEKEGLFYMYYSARMPNRNGKEYYGLGVAVSDNPLKGFKDYNKSPIIWAENTLCIDPQVGKAKELKEMGFPIPDEYADKEFLVSGSGPLIRMHLLNTNAEPITLITADKNEEFAIEGAFLVTTDKKIVLTYSAGRVFGQSQNGYGSYHIRYAEYDPSTRSFIKPDDNILVESNMRWKNIGNGSFITDDDGQLWLYAHGIELKKQYFIENEEDPSNWHPASPYFSYRKMIRMPAYVDPTGGLVVPGGRVSQRVKEHEFYYHSKSQVA